MCVHKYVSALLCVFLACWCMNETSLVTALCVCLWPCLWVGAHVSIDIFSTTSHCNAMALICTLLNRCCPPPPSTILPNPPSPTYPILNAFQSATTFTLAGISLKVCLKVSFTKKGGESFEIQEWRREADQTWVTMAIKSSGKTSSKLLHHISWVLFLSWALANLNIN